MIKPTGEMSRTTYRGKIHHIVVATEIGKSTACGMALTGMAVWPLNAGIKVAVCPTCEKCREVVKGTAK